MVGQFYHITRDAVHMCTYHIHLLVTMTSDARFHVCTHLAGAKWAAWRGPQVPIYLAGEGCVLVQKLPPPCAGQTSRFVQYNSSPEFHGVRRKEKKIKNPDEKSSSFPHEPSDLVGGL